MSVGGFQFPLKFTHNWGIIISMVLIIGCDKPDDNGDVEILDTKPSEIESVDTPLERNQESTNTVSQPSPPEEKINRFDLYQNAFARMDLERDNDLVKIDQLGHATYAQIEESDPRLSQILDTLDFLSQAAFHESQIDWGINYSDYPMVEIKHWRYMQHGGLIVQWWIHYFIQTQEIENAFKILQIGFKMADDIHLDGSLPGVLIALQLRDELIQIFIDNFQMLSKADCQLLAQNLIPYAVTGESWTAGNFLAAQAELNNFLQFTKTMRDEFSAQQKLTESILQNKDFAICFYNLEGYKDPFELAILKGIPASTLQEDPDKAAQVFEEIRLQKGKEMMSKFASLPTAEQDTILSDVSAIHKKLGDVLKSNTWNDYYYASSKIGNDLEGTIFIWQHAVAWLKARKMEFISRMKFSLFVAGLIHQSEDIQMLPQVTNPITGSIPKRIEFLDQGVSYGFVMSIEDLGALELDAFSPFHRILFITSQEKKYHTYGYGIGRLVNSE